MAPPIFNMFRMLRLQLKTGFIRNEPAEYNFLKRYPPLTRDNVPRFHKFTKRTVPYMELYEKAVTKHPKYDESIYPAYWQQEPLALTLAKKQYAFMQEGDSEEIAFRKAEKYVDDIENKSYVELLAIRETLNDMNAKPPFMTDSEIAEKISYWKAKLQETMYEDLELADQGEVDYFIQTKILKWTEVQRERRMKDVIFYNEFHKLRDILFPINATIQKKLAIQNEKEFRSFYFKIRSLDPSKLTCATPFYLEDYVSLFTKMSQQPNLRKWSLRDLNHFTDWIENTLAMRQIIEKRTKQTVDDYLDHLKITFFPILNKVVNTPTTTSTSSPSSSPNSGRSSSSSSVGKFSFPIPTVDSIKKILYQNQIGYKVEDGKVYVKRFYRIPALLFPKETFAANLINDRETLE